MSPSAPYIYNPKECVILAYKKNHIKKVKGEPEWVGELGEREDKNGVMKPKTFYTEAQKREFIDLVFGQWNYFADTRSLTKATFSMDIPTKAIKILTYKNDVVLDPFAGSGTSLVAAEVLDRQWIGIELSPQYAEVARKRVNTFVEEKRQQVLEFNKEN
jgi:DNA modification methylase